MEIRDGRFFKRQSKNNTEKPSNFDLISQIKGVFKLAQISLGHFPDHIFLLEKKREAVRIRQITRPCLFNEGDGLNTGTEALKGVLVTS